MKHFDLQQMVRSTKTIWEGWESEAEWGLRGSRITVKSPLNQLKPLPRCAKMACVQQAIFAHGKDCC